MIRTAATYEDLAPSIIEDLEDLDREETAYADAMETLSTLSSIRDSEALGSPLAIIARRTWVASIGRAIAAFPTEDGALEWVRGYRRAPFGGFAIVKVDRTGPVDVYTALETELL